MTLSPDRFEAMTDDEKDAAMAEAMGWCLVPINDACPRTHWERDAQVWPLPAPPPYVTGGDDDLFANGDLFMQMLKALGCDGRMVGVIMAPADGLFLLDVATAEGKHIGKCGGQTPHRAAAAALVAAFRAVEAAAKGGTDEG